MTTPDPTPTFAPVEISAKMTASEIAKEIQNSARSGGVLRMTDLPAMPTSGLEKLFDQIHANPEFAKRLNEAYKSNLVFKDSFSVGKG